MNVWVVNPFDNLPLEGNRPQRYWLMSSALAKAGHNVRLFTSDFSHSRKAKRKFVETEYEEEFSLSLIETPAYKRNISFKRILSHRAFAKNWIKEAAKYPPPDVLIISMPPLALGSAAVKYCREISGGATKLVVDIQDAWPETFERIIPRPFLYPLRRVASGIYNSADAITAVADRYVQLARSYGSGCEMKIFRLAAPRNEQVPTRLPLDSAKSLSPAGGYEPDSSVIKLVYVGNMGASYDLSTVIEGVKKMPAISLDLAGSGPDEPKLRKLAEGCERIRFHGYLGREEMNMLLRSSDVALIPMLDDSCVGVPGKLSDYVMAGLPILNSLHGETARLIESHSAGFTYDARKADAFCSAVENIRDVGIAKLSEGAKLLSNEFDAAKVYSEYAKFIFSISLF